MSDGKGGYTVSNNSENIGYYQEVEELTVVGKSKTTKVVEKVDNSVSTIGIVSDLNEGLIGNNTKEVIGRYGRVLGTIGKATGVFGAVSSTRDFINNPTWKTGTKATISIISATKYVNPALGVVIGISDMTGFTDWTLDKIYGK